MSSSELFEHAGYFLDPQKLQAYGQAIDDVVRPGDVVVDLGAGTGLLGLLALRAGAGRVYMVDGGPILGPARDVAACNGFADRVVPIRGFSTDVGLPERADVIVCDQIGGFVYDAGVLQFFADARKRFLKPDGRLVPCRFSLHLAPVNAPGPRHQVDVWASHPAGFDTEPLHRLAINSEWRVKASEATLVAAPATVGTIESSSVDHIVSTMTFGFDEPATVDGLLGWFDAELAPGVHLSNAPHIPNRMQRWCNFYPLTWPIEVVVGDRLEATLDVRPDPGIVTWSVNWFREEDCLGRWRHSTLLGQFLGPDDLLQASNGRALETTAVGNAIAAALQAVDGRSAADLIIDDVLLTHKEAFTSPERGRSVLQEQLSKWTRVRS